MFDWLQRLREEISWYLGKETGMFGRLKRLGE